MFLTLVPIQTAFHSAGPVARPHGQVAGATHRRQTGFDGVSSHLALSTPQFAPSVFVHLEQFRRRASDRSQAGDFRVVFREVFRPTVLPGMEQPSQFTRLRIKAREVWSLVEIAVVAGEREIFRRVAAFMLSRNNVFDVESQRLLGLRQSAVFAGVVRARADELAERLLHQSWT